VPVDNRVIGIPALVGALGSGSDDTAGERAKTTDTTKRLAILLIAVTALAFAVESCRATCLDEAVAFADHVCGEIQQGGSSSLLSASGKLSAEAKGLLSKFVGSAGAEISGEALEKKFEGVIQEQLAPERNAARQCRSDMAKFAVKEVSKSSQFETVPAIRAECEWNSLPQKFPEKGRMYFLPIDIAVDPRNIPDGPQQWGFLEFF